MNLGFKKSLGFRFLVDRRGSSDVSVGKWYSTVGASLGTEGVVRSAVDVASVRGGTVVEIVVRWEIVWAGYRSCRHLFQVFRRL